MQLTFLGTGTSQGIPVVGCTCDVCSSSDPRDQRLRTSAYVRQGETGLLIDTGPDLRMQLLRNDITDVDAILYTHEHNDHVIGLDDIRPMYFRRKSNIPTYALPRVVKELKSRFAYMFSDNPYPGVAQIDTHYINKDTAAFDIGSINVRPIGIHHGKLDILGYRFGDIAYITDASKIDESEIIKLKNVKTVIVNALMHKAHHSHFTLEEAIAFINDIDAETGYILHISHLMGSTKSVEALLPNHIHVAYDGLVVEV